MASALPQYLPWTSSTAAATTSSQSPLPPQHAMSSFSSATNGRSQSFVAPQIPQQSGHAFQAQRFQSFQDQRPEPARSYAPPQKPQIYTAVYSSVAVYEMEVNKVAVMRRRSDSWLNATQILKVAGVEKGRRTKIIEKEILPGQHEKVQGGYGRYQGTWINYERGREFCRQYDVEDILRPLLDYDIASDGKGNQGKNDTPTKEQAMAANRKRFYNNSIDRAPTSADGPLFSNISPVATSAIAAVNKAARYDASASRPGSAQKRPASFLRRTSSQQYDSNHDPNLLPASQQSFVSENAMDIDSAYNSQPRGYEAEQTGLEPPRKKYRPSFSHQDSAQTDGAFEETPTEPNESFMYPQEASQGDDTPFSLAPLAAVTDRRTERKQALLLDLFADTPSRINGANHEALTTLSGTDLDIPLDPSANTALHWAATLARLPLVRSLLNRGANMFRGNAAGQTPLMAAVRVNNSWDNSCFPEMLDLFGPLIEVRDASGRTVLHHIAVSSAIKGRSQSSRYYLESLLVYMVRQGSGKDNATASFGGGKVLTLPRFMAEVVNVQDKSGNTALNLVARMGNRAIIDQLDELGADFTLPNNTGFTPKDFGVFPKSQAESKNDASAGESSSRPKSASAIDQMQEEIKTTLASVLSQATQSHEQALSKVREQLDKHQTTLRDLASQHADEALRCDELTKRAKVRSETGQKVANLRQAIKESRSRGVTPAQSPQLAGIPITIDANKLPSSTEEKSMSAEQKQAVSGLAPASRLRAQIRAYEASNQAMRGHIANLGSRSIENEAMYRKVVSLCTGIEEDKVDGMVESMLVAVQSEQSTEATDVSRVRDFLKRVESTVSV